MMPNDDKITKQIRFVKALAARLPEVAPAQYYGYDEDKPSKQSMREDIRRLRRELLTLAELL